MDFVKSKLQKAPITTLTLVLTLALLLTIIPLCYPLQRYPLYLFQVFSKSSYLPTSTPSNNSGFSDPKLTNNSAVHDNSEKKNKKRYCDLFSGNWIPNPESPYYTNTTCLWGIHEHQNCMKYGRPDTDFLKWRWKPEDCELPIFDPHQFFEIVRGKSMAFVGDSLARNQVQSLICLLSKVEYPIDVSYTQHVEFKRWNYTTYNFIIATLWTPFLVKTQETDIFNLYLDEFDENWTSQVENFDYVIISSGPWFFRPGIYYENRKLVGCRSCQKEDITDLPISYGYKRAFSTAFRAINSLENFKGITFLRTFSPSHFENGEWNNGGNCVRQRPFKSNETRLEGAFLELYRVQLEEYKRAEKEGAKRGLKYRLLDTTQAMLLRPDGHPSRYGHWPHANVTLYNDCVHWCLPGPIDTWNEFLLEMLKMEGIL